MKVLILGVDGYLGWALANSLANEDCTVYGIDSFFRRKWVKEMKSVSAIPIATVNKRLEAYKAIYKKELFFYKGNITDYSFLSSKIKDIQPDTIIHFAQCPSAPYSMMNQEKSVWVQTNNVVGTINLIHAVKEYAPQAHIVKLGTMGEYGTPNIDIPEGFFEIEYRGRKDRLPFPRQANSWYHLSKVHDSNNLQFACRNYGIRCTDIMQGVVFGVDNDITAADKKLSTRLDFDQAFGTVINRFCCEAIISHAITVYGDGTQTRSFLPLIDSINCIKLVMQHPPATAEYRVVNQFANVFSINDLAKKISTVCAQLKMDISVTKLQNPRKEAATHYYNPDNDNLKKLGYVPTTEFEQEIFQLIHRLKPFAETIKKYNSILNPTIRW